MSTARETRRDELFAELVADPAGLTVDDMMEWGWSHHQANDAIHDLRAYLGQNDDVNLVCEPQGKGEPWLYRLVGSLADVRGWSRNRITDTESRLRTMQSVLASIVSATSGRTVDGRKVRLMERSVRRLVEDLDDLSVL